MGRLDRKPAPSAVTADDEQFVRPGAPDSGTRWPLPAPASITIG